MTCRSFKQLPAAAAALLPAAALKLVGESFPWGPASAFVHLRDNHTRQAQGTRFGLSGFAMVFCPTVFMGAAVTVAA